MAGAPRRRITVVNDNPEFLELMQVLLEEDSGYDVTTIDGDLVASLDPIRDSRPELLIIDLVMRPDRLSGWDILQGVRRDDELREVPVIICTADTRAVRERAEEIAQDLRAAILEKPFAIDELEAIVTRMLSLD